MPSSETNVYLFNVHYNWSQQGDEWSAAWGGVEAQWVATVFPRIHAFIPTGTILEIAPGYGRWTQYLKNYCDHLIVVDLAERCIEACRERFSTDSHLTYHVNDGKSLAMIPDGSLDFVFSLDSLVVAEADVIEGYLDQLVKKLKPNGVGLIHHSNIGEYRYVYSPLNRIPFRFRKPLIKRGLLYSDKWRAYTMTARLFEKQCEKAGLQCISQELINWYGNGKLLIDCFSLFTPKGSIWARPNNVFRNPNYMNEARYISRLSRLYATSQLRNGNQEV